jgi:hypothetical protein
MRKQGIQFEIFDRTSGGDKKVSNPSSSNALLHYRLLFLGVPGDPTQERVAARAANCRSRIV